MWYCSKLDLKKYGFTRSYYEIMLEPISRIDWIQRNRASHESPRWQWMGFNTTTKSRQVTKL